MIKRNPLTITVGTLLLVIFGLLLFMYQVRVTEVAVVTTFGKPTRPITEPGAYAKWPWPIQKVHKFDKRIHNFETKFEQVLTSDGFNLLIMLYVGWQIENPEIFFPRFQGSVNKAQGSLEGLVRNAYSGVVGLHPMSSFVSANPEELKFVEMEKAMLDRIQKDVQDSGYGIEVKFLGIKRLGLPESVTEAVFAQMKAEREVLVNQIRSQGTEQASAIRTAAQLESAKLLDTAEADAVRVRSLGEAEAAKSFQVFQKNPELATLLLKLNALKAFLQENTTLVLDRNVSPLDLLSDQTLEGPQDEKGSNP